MLILTRKVDEKIMIGSDIAISVAEIRPGEVKIGVEAPKNVKVFRKEIFDEINAENRKAAHTPPVIPALDLRR